MKVLDFVLWLNYYYCVLLDCFPLLLHFLTSLIKFALWNLGKAYEAKTFLQTRKLFFKQGIQSGVVFPGEGPTGSCSVS